MTGLTQDGEAVASSSYKLYGSTKKSTDETGNPYAYNGEARDGTGLDYLRARYYDSHAGTFLTEDSYQGELTDPLSQNRYSYVHNNPVNYTDPSGHRFVLTTMGGGGKPASIASAFTAGIKNFASRLVAPIKTAVQFASVSIKAATATVRYTMVKAHPHHYTDAQKAKVRSEYLSAVGEKVAFHIREAGNLAVNWTKALHQTIRHVCDPKTTKARDKGATLKPVSYGVNLGGVASWDGTSSTSNQPQSNASVVPNLMSEEDLAASRKAGLQLLKVLGGELTGWYNLKRLWTGKDPVTGDKANRWTAAGGLALDVVSYGFAFAKLGKLTKGGKVAATAAKTVDAVDDVSDAVKAVDVVDDVSDTSKGFKAVDAVDDVVQGAGKGTKGAGRAKNKIKPDANATGAHSVYKRDSVTGQITNYKTYEPNPYNPSGFQQVKGYDGVGASHKNSITGEKVPTPHVHDKNIPGGVRSAEDWEIPTISRGN